MQTLLLLVHIVAMSASLLLTVGALVLGFLKRPSLLPTAKGALVATLVGTASGLGLLWYAPTAALCLTLTLYLVAFMLAYRFAFGNGKAEACPFLAD